MASDDFIPVVGDDWYQRRRQDAEGDFLRKVAAQGPRGDGGGTLQGIYTLTPDGTLLAYKNAGQAPDVMREVLRGALDTWKRLPEARRRPGAITAGAPGPVDEQYDRTPPEDGLIVKVFTRALEREEAGSDPDRYSCAPGRGGEAARDHLWLTREDWKALIPARNPAPGQVVTIPDRVVERIVRFHLVDNTRGEPPFWSAEDVREAAMTLMVEDVSPDRVRLRLKGKALLATSAEVAKADRGYDASVMGIIEVDRRSETIRRFDVVALGEHWGEGRYTRGARPGRSPLGVAFSLVDGSNPADRIAPQASRYLPGYLNP
ncbi:hypothetical protein [Tautonia rosea]|uniref:hypothetical protein n=1 Tax=Tautonia rosea TaxID=2728037 RepID=UPI001472A24B|nr:hypothetical protein [Tautonia rosea]